MWLWIVLILVLLGWFYPIREPFTSTSDTVEEQAGSIQQLHDQLTTITFTEASIASLQSENDQTTDQIRQLQQNMPSKEPAKAYPPE